MKDFHTLIKTNLFQFVNRKYRIKDAQKHNKALEEDPIQPILSIN